MKIIHLTIITVFLFCWRCHSRPELPVTPSGSDLQYEQIPLTWDEGIPLGNATVGALVWLRDTALRMSLDRTDLWDLRPMENLSGAENRFAWVCKQVREKNYLPVQQKFDWPYELQAAPSKIPGAALEFRGENMTDPAEVRLYLNNALCEVRWKNGMTLKTFVQANETVGWFVFENMTGEIKPVLIAPQYKKTGNTGASNSVDGQSLERLGYKQGRIEETADQITYHQEGWNGFSYQVNVKWVKKGNQLLGVWGITSSMSEKKAVEETEKAMRRGIKEDYRSHINFWKSYWQASSVSLPDHLLQKQYDNEMYKFGSATRENSYPISLQAVWTADNGKLPPWKGDYHHDLNTQLSYWPAYIGNHLQEGMGYLNTLWNQRETYKKYTRQYFETEGMNVPGVCTLTGEPMGGWIQYSMSQTVSAWLGQHFYLHWKYSANREFLKERAYPFLKEVAIYLEQISRTDTHGKRKLQISSSPEIFDNSIQAWFQEMTNYDLSLMHFAFGAAAELAGELNLPEESAHWRTIKEQLPDFDTDADGALTFAKGFSYNQSHRHFSHAMAIHPLGLIDWSQGERAQQIIKATLQKLKDHGPDYWTGYSYSWLANLQARAFDGEGAAESLRTFAQCFCLPNTFHVNGDQSKSGKSKFTYRPFTLEGNFAFAAGIQEMLLQSHTGIIRVFPAIPAAWRSVAFDKLRAMGAYLISARQSDGKIEYIRIYPEEGGPLCLAIPQGQEIADISGHDKEIQIENGILKLQTQKGCTVNIRMK